jgi:cobaltochelatase CobN
MHLLVRDSVTLDDQEQAEDLGQTPADLVFLSFSDADLAGFAAAWQRMAGRPALRLASLARLRHPMSVDLYIEQVIQGARCVVVRLLGGLDYWRYGVEELRHACQSQGIAFVAVPGDGLEDARLAALSTADAASVARMDGFLRHGGAENLDAALRLAASLAGLAADDGALPVPVAPAGEVALGLVDGDPLAVIVFYRSHLLADDIAPVTALAAALAERGLGVRALFVSSLKDPAAADFIAARLRAWRPAVVLNATLFSAWRDGLGATLEAAGCPVLQVILAVGGEAAWRAGFRGLSQTDLAMQVVLPELDGRLLTTAISFKAAEAEIPGLDFARSVNQPHPEGLALAADRAAGWARLARTAARDRRVALVLSDYPGGGGQTGHAVGLDSFASLSVILGLLQGAGYTAADAAPRDLAAALCAAPATGFLSLEAYGALFATLPAPVRAAVEQAWGRPDEDPSVVGGQFTLRHARLGHMLLAVQPDRGSRRDRKSGYHDADQPPRHGYVAFYLWLRLTWQAHAMVHLGTHGTLEWLPGKACALSADCAPVALLRGLPVVYPFIVNNPGEAAAAKRRLGAVTIGHMTPPMTSAGTAGLAGLDRLIDEYAAADGLDRRRGAVLRQDILARAAACGLLAESGADRADGDEDALARLDAYLCDVKDLQIRQGLHVFATPSRHRRALLDAFARQSPDFDPARLDACAAAEAEALLAALDGRFVPPGPAGAPTRARADVLPTGRNLFTTDPRAVPTRAAWQLAQRVEAELLRRHRQDQGEDLRHLVLDLWGNTSLRTGGEDFALAFRLLGVTPCWDAGSARVSGFEILPLAVLDRPRVDVTLRLSGLCRDLFETQIALFDAAVRAVAARDEAADWNPLAGAADTARVFGPAPGQYGIEPASDRAGAADAYLAASATSYAAADGDFAARVAAAQAFLHTQDHAETDLLDSTDYAAHEGGFAAAAARLGATPALYHADTATPEAPRLRLLAEEIARVTRGRAANPDWIAGQLPHGPAGAAEIARAVDSLAAFAVALPQRLDRQFDLLFDATLGAPAIDAFLARENPAAREAMRARFAEALARDLWRPQRNSVALALVAAA